MKIYFIPGLGFDHRIFLKLDLGDLNREYLDWIEPKTNETIQDYAERLSEKIQDDSVVLIGHSFGGVMAQEIARLKKVKRVILISSIKSRAEIPFYFKLIAPLGIHRLLSKRIILSSFRFWAKSYGYKTKEEQDLFKSMVRNHSNHYLQWALRELSVWQAPSLSETKIVHLHGTKDNTLPIGAIKKPVIAIPGESHFMVYRNPELVSRVILTELPYAQIP